MDMNTQQTNGKKTENSRTTFSLIAAFVVVLIIVSVVAYKAGIDPKQIKADVAAFADNISKRYAARGIDVKLTYTDIEVKGGIFEKSILLKKPHFSVRNAQVDYALSTDEVKIVPHDSHYDELTIEALSPLLLTKNSGAMQATYSSATPLKIDVLLNEEGAREYVMPLPVASTVQVEKAGEKKTYAVTNNDSSFISGLFDESAKNPYSFSVAVGQLRVKGNSSDVTVESVSLTSSKSEENSELEVTIAQFKTNKLPDSLGGLDLTVSQKSKKDELNQDNVVELEEALLTGEGFNIGVKGKLRTKKDQLLPLVDVNVEVNGASKLFAALGETTHFTPKHKMIVVQALKLIEPEWKEFSLSPLSFVVKRDENAPFVIGEAKADELLALILQQYLQLEQTPAIDAVQPTEASPVEEEEKEEVTPEAEKEVSEPVAEKEEVAPKADDEKGENKEETPVAQ